MTDPTTVADVGNIGAYGVWGTLLIIVARSVIDYLQHQKTKDAPGIDQLAKSVSDFQEWQARWNEDTMRAVRDHRDESARAIASHDDLIRDLAEEARSSRRDILAEIQAFREEARNAPKGRD